MQEYVLPSDEELAAQAVREGSDGTAFTSLVERFRTKVWRVCWRLMGNEHDAQDAAQEVFVRLFFERGKFQGRSSYSTWLHAVAIRTCLTLRRTRTRRRRREDSAEEDQIENVSDGASEKNARSTGVIDTEKLLDDLDEEDRALVLMRFAENHDYEVLAEMFDMTAGACRMRISRLRERLAAKAAKQFSE